MTRRQKSRNWRQRPATKAQQRQLERYGLPLRADMLQGEASELIGTKRPPSEDELRILQFFKIQGLNSYSQTVARRGIEKLFSDPENLKKWEARPAEKEQRKIYQFFRKPIPRGLTWKHAHEVIEELFADEKNEEAWIAQQEYLDEIQEAAEERKDWLEETREIINEGTELYDYKKLSKKLFSQVVERLEAKGMTLEEIEEQEKLVIWTAYQLDPTRVNPGKPENSPPRINTAPLFRSSPSETPKSRYMTGWVIALLIICVLFFAAVVNR